LLLEALGFAGRLSSGARMVLRNLERRPIRTGATIIGMGLAVALLVSGQFPYDAFDRLLEVEFRQSQRYSAALAFSGERSAATAAELRHVDGVIEVEPFRATAIRIVRGAISRTTTLTGIEPGGNLYRLTDTRGDVFAVPTRGVVFTAGLARLLGIQVGDTIAVELLARGGVVRPVVVAGVFDPMIGQGVFASREAVNRVLRDDAVSGAYIAIAPGSEERVFAKLKDLPGVAAATSRAATLRNLEQQMREGMRFALRIIIASAILIAGGVVYNSARIALSERGRELATLRVLGFTSNEVGGMLLAEQAAMLALALPIGIALGALFSYALVLGFETERFHFPFVVTFATQVFAAVVTIAAAVLASLVVRRRVGRLNLVSALRTRE
jgi:putative ABC transport system permease protein